MKLIIATIVALASIAIGPSAYAIGSDNSGGPTPSPTTQPCQEDQPCWDCHTMGNLICGPTTTIAPTTTTTQPTAPTGSLPFTGGDVATLLGAAAILLIVGGTLYKLGPKHS